MPSFFVRMREPYQSNRRVYMTFIPVSCETQRPPSARAIHMLTDVRGKNDNHSIQECR